MVNFMKTASFSSIVLKNKKRESKEEKKKEKTMLCFQSSHTFELKNPPCVCWSVGQWVMSVWVAQHWRPVMDRRFSFWFAWDVHLLFNAEWGKISSFSVPRQANVNLQLHVTNGFLLFLFFLFLFVFPQYLGCTWACV